MVDDSDAWKTNPIILNFGRCAARTWELRDLLTAEGKTINACRGERNRVPDAPKNALAAKRCHVVTTLLAGSTSVVSEPGPAPKMHGRL